MGIYLLAVSSALWPLNYSLIFSLWGLATVCACVLNSGELDLKFQPAESWRLNMCQRVYVAALNQTRQS